MCLTRGANRFVYYAESLPAYRVQRHTCSQISHVKVATLFCNGKVWVLKDIKFEVLEVCCDEFVDKIKVVINCVTRLYQTKLNCFDFKTSFGPNNSRKFGFESFLSTMVQNWCLCFGSYYGLK